MDANILTGPKFLDWLKNLRIVLKKERLAYVIVEPLPESLVADTPESVQRAYQKHLVDRARTGLIIHTSMSLEFQKQYKTMDAYSILCHLREHYNEHARTERFKVSGQLCGSKMEEGTFLMQHALKMYEHMERLDQLGYRMDFELCVDFILVRLPNSFAQFVLDYGMGHIISTILELIGMLKIAEGKMVEKKGKETAPKETCFYCGQVGYWKRKCKAYLELKKKVACDAPSSSSIYVIKVNTVSTNNI